MERTPVTIKEFLKLKGYSVTNLAIELGVSISLISKLKNCNTPMSYDFMDKFKRRFPDYILTGGVPHWKEMYQDLEKKYKDLEKQLASAEKKIEKLQVNFQMITDISNDPDKTYSLRKFR